MAPRTSNKVKVYARTRPTNNFASDMLSLGRDNRVSFLFMIELLQQARDHTFFSI